jgi:deoxyribose-phosphate aldolase
MYLEEYIDYTILKPFCTKWEVLAAYQTFKEREYKGFCIPSCYLPLIRKEMGYSSGYQTLITVVGFPFGYQSIMEKVQSILSFRDFPPDEIDFVINLSAAKSGDWKYLNEELYSIHQARNEIYSFYSPSQNKRPILLKAIIESPHWDDLTLDNICELCVENGIDFIKTSTGFLEDGISLENKLYSIIKIKEFTFGSNVQIKVSGGIRDRETAMKAIKLGVSRIGTSSPL